MKKLRISEIFGPTIQGEGALIGKPTVFVRAGGCDYRCSWCDTLYAVENQFRSEFRRALRTCAPAGQSTGTELPAAHHDDSSRMHVPFEPVGAPGPLLSATLRLTVPRSPRSRPRAASIQISTSLRPPPGGSADVSKCLLTWLVLRSPL